MIENPIQDYIAQYAESSDPDDTIVEVDLGVLKEWAWSYNELCMNFAGIQSEAEQTIQKLKAQIAEAKSAQKSMQQEIARLQNDLDELRAEYTQLEKTATGEIKKRNRELKNLRTKMNETRQMGLF